VVSAVLTARAPERARFRRLDVRESSDSSRRRAAWSTQTNRWVRLAVPQVACTPSCPAATCLG